MEVIHARSIRKTKGSDRFIAFAGKGGLGAKPLAALKSDSYSEWRYRESSIIHPYLELYPDMNLDELHCGFYCSREENNQKFTNMSEAMKAYNEVILAKATTPEEAQEYLLRNIPKESPDIEEAEIKDSLGYHPIRTNCHVLSQATSPTNPEETIVLLYDQDSKFAVVDGIKKDKYGRLDFGSIAIPNSKFNIEDIQEGLNQFVLRSKSEVVYGTDEIESQIENSRPDTTIKGNTDPESTRELDDDDAR